MEIHQDNHVCTLGYVDPGLRVAFTAGHCRGSGTVTNSVDEPIGVLATFRDNTPNGATVNTDQVIADYEAIVLADDVITNDVLPGGRRLEAGGPDATVTPGEPVCHFGIVTGETCGTVERVNNGWFTMGHGVLSQQGDSGGPVYVLRGDHAQIVGLFNSKWGDDPAAVSWPAISQQVREDVGIPAT
ncbi:MAG: hypothetical protein ABI307_11565 [Mycobacterium sp.]